MYFWSLLSFFTRAKNILAFIYIIIHSYILSYSANPSYILRNMKIAVYWAKAFYSSFIFAVHWIRNTFFQLVWLWPFENSFQFFTESHMCLFIILIAHIMCDINNVPCKHIFPYSMGVVFGNLKCIKLIMVTLWHFVYT